MVLALQDKLNWKKQIMFRQTEAAVVPDAQEEKNDKIISINFASKTLWSHNAMLIGETLYVSIHPAIHFSPASTPLEMDSDPSDYAPQVRAIAFNVRTLLCSRIGLGQILELKYMHDQVEIPVTPAQHEKAKAWAEEIKTHSADGKFKYSILGSIGISCASAHQRMLEVVTEGTPEEPLARPHWPERMTGVIWPQWSYERAQQVAIARRAAANQPTSIPTQPQPTQVHNPHRFFSWPTRTRIRTPAEHALKIERLTYF